MGKGKAGKIKRIAVLVLAFALVIIFSACEMNGNGEVEPTPENYNITLDIIGEGEIIEPEEGDYPEGITDLSAAPEDGWEFYRWEGDVQDKFDKDSSVNLDSDKEITAIFIEDYEGDYNENGFAGWEGTEEKPFMIKNSAQLNNVRDEMEAYFILINDIDLTDFNEWDPIGDFEENKPFLGFFDGREYEINNLYINLEEDVRVGLFSYLDGEAVVKNLNIIDADVTGRSHTGILAGGNGFNDIDSQIINVYTSGRVEALFAVGGIVGTNYALVEDSSSDSTVTGIGGEFEIGILAFAGGLAGQNRGGRIINCFATGKVSGEGSNVGGLLGSDSYVTERGGEIDNCYAEGEVIGELSVGGLVGNLSLDSELTDSYASGKVTGKNTIGGLVGGNSGNITNSQSNSDVKGDMFLGGLVGSNAGNITNSYTNVEVEGDFNLGGGLVGINHGNITDCYAEGNISGNSLIGGLIGTNYGNITEHRL